MKSVFFLVFGCLFSVFAIAGTEFWDWQTRHKQLVEQKNVAVLPEDLAYIQNLSDSWETQAMKLDEYVPLNYSKTMPKKQIINIEKFESARAQQLTQPLIEILDTKHILSERISFDFYQHHFQIKDSSNWQTDLIINQANDVSKVWSYFASLPTEHLIEQMLILKQSLNLNDWDYAVMLFQYSSIWQNDINAQLLQAHYLLVKSGLNVRIGFANEKVYLLMQTQLFVLNESYVQDSMKKRWYIMDFNNDITPMENIDLVEKSHSNSKEPLKLLMNPKLNLGGQWQHKLFNYQVGNTQYDIYLPFQADILEHYKYYPILLVDNYINQEIHEIVFQSIYEQIKDKINPRDEQKTINFLLNFVQTLIKENKETGNVNKQLFVQQVVFESKGGAQERVLLFKNLVEKILGNYMMIVLYDNHISTGVKLKTKQNLSAFHVNLNDYVFADPSYTHAKLGEKMPLENSPFKKWLPIY
ncbi:hypothetical protein [Marinicellulosiphila megalodicopiae]|uniref:hypothetical protein n=1 Tax=Marinicellulosiphila megalodicopiae TaxID=2724896 RepID=UPI003BB07616